MAPPDTCSSNSCQNGGVCNLDMDGTGYTCDCSGTGYEGDQCADEIDECASSPCQNGGTCQDEINKFTCLCGGTGYEGDTCNTAGETNATVTDNNRVYTVSNCPVGVGYIPIDATGDGPATWIEPTATSTNGGASISHQSHQPGVAIFTFDSNTQVTYQWQDAAGVYATCQFWIRLQTAGVITVNSCPPSPITATSTGSAVAVTWPTPTATSNIGATVNIHSSTHSSGSSFDIGDTVVEYYWTDTNSNVANCMFTVSVDFEPITVNNCPTSPITVTANGSRVTVTWTTPTATSNIGATVNPAESSPTHYPGWTFNIGDTQVTYNWQDTASNSATCIFIVKVIIGRYTAVIAN
ncbi:hyalin-like [Amphiura filiformis]|uniref:hyalin-like n=1 Tax=Amphiura filiformis TaxID=82378 RepID=UPI003B212F1D